MERAERNTEECLFYQIQTVAGISSGHRESRRFADSDELVKGELRTAARKSRGRRFADGELEEDEDWAAARRSRGRRQSRRLAGHGELEEKEEGAELEEDEDTIDMVRNLCSGGKVVKSFGENSSKI